MNSLQSYIDKMKEVQMKILNFIENEYNVEENFDDLIELLTNIQIKEDKYDLQNLLYLISKISNNHNRVPHFFNKIMRIIIHFKADIQKFFTNSEILNVFQRNKLFLLNLMQEEILIFDYYIADKITEQNFIYNQYPYFFQIELKPFLIPNNKIKKKDNNLNIQIEQQIIPLISSEVPEDFEEKRKTGENDNYLSEVIRKDMIEEFIIYVNKKSYSLNSLIDFSYYETNSLIFKRVPSLIQYAVFFGSVQIFKYLYKNDVNLEPDLWIYAIHGNTPEIIHILEENQIKPTDHTFKECFYESKKCHHFDISNYIESNLLIVDEPSFVDKKFDACGLYELKFYNYSYINVGYEDYFLLLYACRYNNYKMVEILLKTFNMQDIDKHKSNFKYTPYLAAADKDYQEIIKLLLVNDNKIRENCFHNSYLTKLEIPSSITKIEAGAFKSCYYLSSVTLPSSLISIGDASFLLTSLSTIKIPSSVTSIGKSSFEACEISSIDFELPSSLSLIPKEAFRKTLLKEIKIPNSVKSIGSDAFSSCKLLEKVEIPLSVVSIGSFVFFDCKSLIEITIPSSLTDIGHSTFSCCTSLEKINICSPLTSIEKSMFEGCSNLKKFKIPSSVKTIGKYSFTNCYCLTDIELPSSLTLIESHAFKNCSKLKQILIPSSVNKIYGNAFEECTEMENIIFKNPSSLTSIEKNTFKYCISLKEIIIPSSVKTIKQSAFEKCTSLIKAVIPDSVISIDDSVFARCSSIIEIKIPESVKSFGKNVFLKCSSLRKIYAPYDFNLNNSGIDSNVNITRYS